MAFAVFLSTYYVSHVPLRQAAVIEIRDTFNHLSENFNFVWTRFKRKIFVAK
jgi:hypothetical protein